MDILKHRPVRATKAFNLSHPIHLQLLQQTIQFHKHHNPIHEKDHVTITETPHNNIQNATRRSQTKN